MPDDLKGNLDRLGQAEQLLRLCKKRLENTALAADIDEWLEWYCQRDSVEKSE